MNVSSVLNIINNKNLFYFINKIFFVLGKETFTLYFGVKFYSADPCKLLEEITR